MRDRQSESTGQTTSIPVVSPCLHCVAMTAIVFLRSDFGIDFLRPKSVFLAFSWAILLLTIIVWNETYLWQNVWPVTHFFFAAAALYCIHLAIATYKQIRGMAEHDQYAGTSHLLRLLPGKLLRGEQAEFIELAVHFWIEPSLVFVAALIMRVLGESYLSTWLILGAAAFWLKELLNYWLGIRREKRNTDNWTEVEATIPLSFSKAQEMSGLCASRRPKSRRTRTHSDKPKD